MRRAMRVLVQVLLVLALLATVPVTGGQVAHAVPGTPNVIPCQKPFAEYLVVGQYRSFGNAPAPEVRLGIPASGRLKGKLSATQIAWAPGANAVSFSYVPATDRLWFTVSNVFGSFSRSFETPTTTELANPDSSGGFNQSLEPQIADNFEVGIKGERNGAYYEVSVFHIDLTDELVPFELASSPGRTF